MGRVIYGVPPVDREPYNPNRYYGQDLRFEPTSDSEHESDPEQSAKRGGRI